MKRLNTLAIFIGLAFGLMTPTYAGGSAYSYLEISNFQIFKGDSSTAAAQWSFNDFQTIGIANDAEDHATLTGFPSSDHTQTPTTGNINLTEAYSGLAGGNPDNNYAQTLRTPGLLFSRADTDLNGAIISNVPGGINNSAKADSVSEIQIGTSVLGAHSGTDSARIGTATGFIFSLAKPGGIFDFRFNAKGILETFLDQSQFSSRADYNFNINIKDLTHNTTVFNWTPSNSLQGGILVKPEAFNLNDGCSVVGMALPIKCSTTGSGSFEAITTAVLAQNTVYQLSIQHKTSASLDVLQVPEPGSLSLLGAGLLIWRIRQGRKPFPNPTEAVQ